METHRKTVRRFHEPGDCHELTFSCYRRLPLLTDDDWCRLLSEGLDRAMRGHGFRLVAFVFMPEHVHLLVYPSGREARIDLLLKAIKRPCSAKIKQRLLDQRSPLLDRLTVRERPGVERFRFWQEGGGYDRNLRTESAVMAAIDYIHLNPVRRGLCDRATGWKWSSADRFHEPNGVVDPDLPEVSGLPAEFFVSTGE